MNEVLKDAYKQYRALGFILNKTAHQKKHAYRKGAYIERANEEFEDNATGYAGIIPPNLIIVDNDKYQDGGDSLKKLMKDLGLKSKPEAFAITPSGGEHYAFENPYEDMVIGNVKKEYPALDIYAGYQSVIPIVGTEVINKQGELASYKWDSFDDTFIVNPFNEKMVDLFKMRKRAEGKNDDYDDDGLELAIKANDMPDSEVEELLSLVPDNADYDTWLAVGMCLYDRYEANKDGRKKWLEFSKRSSEKFDEGFTLSKWDNGHLKPTQTTYKRLRSIGNEYILENIKTEISESNADDFDEIIQKVKNIEKLSTRSLKDGDARLEIATSLNSRMKELKVNVTQARTIVKQLSPEVKVGNTEFLNDIVYVESFSGTQFYYIPTGERFSQIGISSKVSEQLMDYMRSINNFKITMTGLVKQGLIKVCSDHEYNPTSNDRIFVTKSGATKLNTYTPNSRPLPAEEYTKDGLEAINKFVKHLKTLMSDYEAETLLDWLAYTAQNMGKKILWTPLIQSEEGLGKSLIGTLMVNHVFGQANSGTVDSTVIVSPQTSWATSGVFKVLEEIKLAGHNRFEVINQLKPFITNHTVSRVEKYEASSEVPNYCNFIALTNFKDAIPVTTGDRRWWVVYSRLNSIQELEKEVGMNKVDYFQPLHDLANKDSIYGAEFYKFLLDRDLRKFQPNFAPESIHKERMTETEDSKTQHLAELRSLLEERKQGVTPEIISTRKLKSLMKMPIYWEGDQPTDMEISSLLRKLGFTKFPKKIASHKDVHNVWFKQSGLSDDEVRELFHKSMELDDVNLFDDFDEL